MRLSFWRQELRHKEASVKDSLASIEPCQKTKILTRPSEKEPKLSASLPTGAHWLAAGCDPKWRELAHKSAAPVAWPVPPEGYGPWEQVVSNLTEGLVASGHEVTLFAAAGSQTSAHLVETVPHAFSLWPESERNAPRRFDSVSGLLLVPRDDPPKRRERSSLRPKWSRNSLSLSWPALIG